MVCPPGFAKAMPGKNSGQTTAPTNWQDRRMARKASIGYIDDLFTRADYGALAQLSGDICGWAGFDLRQFDYGLPRPIFVFVETLLWASQSQRSGVWTYYEATPPSRQAKMLECLIIEGPPELAEKYRDGMATWGDQSQAGTVDDWIAQNEQVVNRWLWLLLRDYRDLVNGLLA